MAKYKRSKILDIARMMPPRRHSIPGKPFDIRDSGVMKWMLRSPVVWNYIWNNIKQSGAITYNPETGKWQGVDYEPDEN